MDGKSLKTILSAALFLALFWPADIYADYIEGIDTTDANGYGLDSAFKADSGGPVMGGYIAAQRIAYYSSIGYVDLEVFSCSFDEIKTAPDSEFFYHNLFKGISYCVVVQNVRDSTYSKVQIIQRLTGNRFIYKYGHNSTPNDHMLEKVNYDRSVRYKPNNICLRYGFFWEPPLPNNNHLLGYIFFIQKAGIVIDTNAPINLAQWDSVYFTTATSCWPPGLHYDGRYFNIIAVYTEGRTDFLKGWTRLPISQGTRRSSGFISYNKNIRIRSLNGKIFIGLPSNNLNVKLSIFSSLGNEVARFSKVPSQSTVWDPLAQHLSRGMYVVKAVLPDHTVLTQPFMFTK